MSLLDNQKSRLTKVDDFSYIQEVHCYDGPWKQYDFLLAARGYGWDYILDSARYMIEADLDKIGTISVSSISGESREYIDEFKTQGNKITNIEDLKTEASMFGLGGISKTLKTPVKIVWINQTRMLRIFTLIDDENLLTRYAETIIRRTFNTDESMIGYKKGAVTKPR